MSREQVGRLGELVGVDQVSGLPDFAEVLFALVESLAPQQVAIDLGDRIAGVQGDDEPHRGDQGEQGHRREQGGRPRIAPAPAPGLLGPAHPPRRDRLAAQPPLQVVRQVLSRAVSLLGLLLQALQADRLEIAGPRAG